MKPEARSAVQIDSELVKQVRAQCPDGWEAEEFVSAFVEKTVANALDMLGMLPADAAARFLPFSRIQPPPLMTRQEVADYCNAVWPGRKDPVSVDMVRWWEREGLLKSHRGFAGKQGRTVRYSADAVMDFLKDRGA